MKVKFLVIRFSSIGDIVLTTPIVRCLKLQHPNAEVHFLTKSVYHSVLSANPYIDKLHLLNDRVSDLKSALQQEHFDYTIDLHQNIRSNKVRSYLGAPAYAFNKLNLQKWLYVNFRFRQLPDVHIVDRYLSTLSSFGIKNDGQGLDHFIPSGEEFDFNLLPPLFREGYVAFVLGGTYFTKRLPIGKVIDICREMDLPVVLLGGKAEMADGEEAAAAVGQKVLNLCGKTALNEAATLVRDARLVLTNDTGLMHIASAYKKKILSFWGNTVPEFGMSPYMPHAESLKLQVEGLSCRPCSKLGFHSCPKRHFNCMNLLDVRVASDWAKSHF